LPALAPATPIRLPPPSSPALAVFTQTAAPGLAKTRLIPLLGGLGAAELHAAMVADTLRKVAALPADIARHMFVARAPLRGMPENFTWRRQRGKDLGERLQNALHVLLRHHPSVVVIGTDSPLLAPRVLREAFADLEKSDAVLGPSLDGGYYLLGLRRYHMGLFRGVRWSSADTFQDMLRNLEERGYSCKVLEPCGVLDQPAEVIRLRSTLKSNPSVRRLAPATWKFLQSRGEVIQALPGFQYMPPAE